MMAGSQPPERVPARLCELSTDAREAVLLDAAGALAGSTMEDRAQAEAFAELARELFEAVDLAGAPGDPAEQVEAQVSGGAVFASRTPRAMPACSSQSRGATIACWRSPRGWSSWWTRRAMGGRTLSLSQVCFSLADASAEAWS